MGGFPLLVLVVAVALAVAVAVASSYESFVVVPAVFALILVRSFDYQKLQHEPQQVFPRILQVSMAEQILKLGMHYLLQPKN